jgi:transcriptional regulator with XRE-family HTH domain
MKVSKKIFDLLAEQEKSQYALAKYVGIAKQTISEWKSKGTDPTAKHISKIAEFFNVSIDELCGREPKEPAITFQVQPPKSEIQEIYDKLNAVQQGILLGEAKRLLEESKMK